MSSPSSSSKKEWWNEEISNVDAAANSARASAAHAASFQQLDMPPPPPPLPVDETFQIVPDEGLHLNLNPDLLQAQMDKKKMALTAAPVMGKIRRPAAGMSNFQRAKSARVLPTAPPPPSVPPLSTSSGTAAMPANFGYQSMANLTTNRGLASSMHAPAPMAGQAMSRAASARFAVGPVGQAPLPPPPPPPLPLDKTPVVAVGVPLGIGVPPPPPVPPPPVPPPPPAEPPIESPAAPEASPSPSPSPPPPTKQEKKKTKKEKEKPIETFHDEPQDDDASVSEHYEELDADEKAEVVEQKVKKQLCLCLLTACGVIFLVQLINRYLFRSSSPDQAVDEGDAMHAVNAAVPPPTGTEAAVNTAVAQHMAVAASQGAAASTAAGTASAAAVSAASAAAAVSVVSAVTTPTVMAVSAVAVTGAAVGSGVYMNMAPPRPLHPCHEFLADKTPRPGYLNLHLEGLPHNIFSVNVETHGIEMAFTQAFNKALGVCLEHVPPNHNDTNINVTDDWNVGTNYYARYMENATLEGWDYWETRDKNGETVNYFTTEWTAFVSCDDVDNADANTPGCSPLEPLFYQGDAPKTTTSSSSTNGSVTFARRRLHGDMLHDSVSLQRQLQDDVAGQSSMQLFMDAFEQELHALLLKFDNGKGKQRRPSVYFAESIAANDTRTIVETQGTKYPPGSLVAGGIPNGTIDRPIGTPTCTPPNPDLKMGYVQLSFQGVTKDFFDEFDDILRQEFRIVYNNITGACDGDYGRVIMKADLLGVSAWQEQGKELLTTNWSALVSCNGCLDHEPLFAVTGGGTGDRSGRHLEIASDTLLARFANSFARAITKKYEFEKPHGVADVYYAAAVEPDWTVVEGAGDAEGPFTVPQGVLVDCSTLQPPPNVDVLPQATFQLSMKNMIQDMNQTILAKVLQDAYNEVTEMCDGPLQRVAHRVTIDNLKQVVGDAAVKYVDMNMTAKLTCTGCDALDEIMFVSSGVGTARQRFLQDSLLFEHFQARVVTEVNALLNSFESTPYYEPGAQLFESSSHSQGTNLPVEISYGATFDKNGRVKYTTGQAIHLSVPQTENVEVIRAGPDVILPVEVCEKDLIATDTLPRDHGLRDNEYFSFVASIFRTLNPNQSWPPNLRKYDDLPAGVQGNFTKFSQGGILTFGSSTPADFEREQARIVRLEAICYYVSHAVRDYIQGVPITAAPTTATPTTPVPTILVTTAAPTVAATNMTAPPTTISPTASPSVAPSTSAAPTETRILEINIKWKFDMNPNNRDATDAEYQNLTSKIADSLSSTMKNAYTAEDDTFDFDGILETRFVSNEYFEGSSSTDSRGYNLAATTSSYFVFRGAQPSVKEVFDKFDQSFDLTAFGESLWATDTTDSSQVWVFDNVQGVTVVSAN